MAVPMKLAKTMRVRLASFAVSAAGAAMAGEEGEADMVVSRCCRVDVAARSMGLAALDAPPIVRRTARRLNPSARRKSRPWRRAMQKGTRRCLPASAMGEGVRTKTARRQNL
ncbi:hypothetical protein MAFF211271_05230 [Ralstonia syzygii subsp. indonesiensis]|nr:hypothetical protein MAFF211271_05230 [Ralstonia pseudosolanacearum]